MTVSSPPRPPSERATPESKPLGRDEIEALVEALIEEARRETRRRRRRYWALAAAVTFVGVVVLTLLERGAASQTASPAVSARIGAGGHVGTSRIAFLRGSPPFNGSSSPNQSELDIINADGSGLRRLAHDSGAAPEWSPDGRKLVFGKRPVRSGAPCRPAGRCKDEIYVINADGTGLLRLTRNAVNDARPAWSPDGRRIAFTRDRDRQTANIYVMNADGSGQRRLTRDLRRRPWVELAWSPDWKKIAFVASAGPLGAADIFVINADGSGLQNVTKTVTTSFAFAWSPDGRRIAYLEGLGKGPLAVVNADGTGKQRLTGPLMVALGPPSWSPDGRTLAFTGLGGDIYTVHADRSGLRKLTHGPGWDVGAEWSPDGRRILFSSSREPSDRTFDLFVMNADGSGQRNLTHTPGVSEDGASWAPS